MNDCIDAEVRDALPDLINGRLSDLDRATLTAHVESCADCRAELELLRELRASAPLAPQIDVARIVSSLPAPMPSSADVLAPARARAVTSSRGSFMWKTAAAAMLLVVGSLTFANMRHQSLPVSAAKPATTAAVIATPGEPIAEGVASVPSAKAANPEVAVVESSNTVHPAARAGLSLAGGVQDLTDDQLQALVNDLDKVQGLPSAEPDPISIGVDDNEGLQ